MNIAVFYHAILDGGAVPIDTEVALKIVVEQMAALEMSGLADAASEIIVGLNGSDDAALMARSIIPAKAKLIHHANGSHSEVPTMAALRNWLPGHLSWDVLYHHTKGITHPNYPFYERWRRRMEQACVWNWRDCVARLERGAESCGCHWLTPEQYPKAVKTPFWGGTFWWAKASYLMTLPPLPEPTWANRYEAESWIGRGPRRPIVHDYVPGWPR